MNEHDGYRQVPFSGDPFEVICGLELTDQKEHPEDVQFLAHMLEDYVNMRCENCGYRLDHAIITHETCKKRRRGGTGWPK